MKRYQKIIGTLRHAALGIPTGKGLFTPLYGAIRNDPKIVHLNKHIKLALSDWKILLKLASKQKINVKQLVSRCPEYIGECDTCTYGLCGVWLT